MGLGKKKALIISISDYSDESLPQLDFCKNDGEEMYNTLINLEYKISDNHKIVGKSNQKQIQDALINFFRKDVSVDDTLLFYFSGHGVLDGYGGRFFANTDVNSKIPEQDGVRFEMLNEQMGKSFAEKKIAILDCCFSGSAVPNLTGKAGDDIEKEAEDLGREGLDKVFGKSQGSCVLASSLSNKRSYSLADKSYSAFTRYIIEGLKGTKDSVDENGFVTPEKLSKYVFAQFQKIPELSHQRPVRNLSIAGEIVLAEHLHLLKGPSRYSQEYAETLEGKLEFLGALLRLLQNANLIFKEHVNSRIKLFESLPFELKDPSQFPSFEEIFENAFSHLNNSQLILFVNVRQSTTSIYHNNKAILEMLSNNEKLVIDIPRLEDLKNHLNWWIPRYEHKIKDANVCVVYSENKQTKNFFPPGIADDVLDTISELHAQMRMGAGGNMSSYSERPFNE